MVTNNAGAYTMKPELDFEYLLDPENLPAIRDNIQSRKGVGDIDLVVSILSLYRYLLVLV